jgi:hypothetical protein
MSLKSDFQIVDFDLDVPFVPKVALPNVAAKATEKAIKKVKEEKKEPVANSQGYLF